VNVNASIERLRLRRQWAIAHERTHLALADRHELAGARALFAHPDASIARATSAQHDYLLLGAAFRTSGESPLSGVNEGLPLESLLEDLGGIYALIVVSKGSIRVFTDPGGMLNVFLGKSGVVASTPAALPETQRSSTFPRNSRGDAEDWMLWDRTPFQGVRVLPANHVLDVNRGEFQRFWPRKKFPSVSFDQAADRGAALMRSGARSLLNRHEIVVSVTGGLDSRVSLAAVHEPDRSSAFTLDCLSREERRIVERIVQVSGVEHRWIELVDAEKHILDLYDEMTLGMSVGARREVSGANWLLRDSADVHLSGNLGAIAKAFYWASGRAVKPTARLLMRDFLVRDADQRRGAEAWIESLPHDLSHESACNLAYLEQRGGRWMGIGETASNLFYAPTTLFSSRKLFEVVCGAPVEAQRHGRLLEAFVERLSPRLAAIPYSSGTAAWRRLLPRRLKAVVGPFLKGRI
jgi:hypothetical protein